MKHEVRASKQIEQAVMKDATIDNRCEARYAGNSVVAVKRWSCEPHGGRVL